MRRVLAWTALLVCAVGGVAAVVVAGVREARGPAVCTAAGCESVIAVGLEDAAYLPPEVDRLQVCVPGRCARSRRGGAVLLATPQSSRRDGARVEVELRALDADGAALTTRRHTATMSEVAPNGRDCGPICHLADVVVRADGTLADAAVGLEGPTGPRGVDILARGYAARAWPRGPAPASLIVAPGTAIELRVARRPRSLRVSFGGSRRRPREVYREGGVVRAIFRVPPRRSMCPLRRLVVDVRDRRLDSYAVPARCARTS